jgi:hypothetical protein
MLDVVMIDCINFIVMLIFVNVVLIFCVIWMNRLVLQNIYFRFVKLNLDILINFYIAQMFRAL